MGYIKAATCVVPLLGAPLIGACSNDDSPTTADDEGYLSVCQWDEDLSALSALVDQDTISMTLLDTCLLFVDTDMDTCMITYLEKYINVEQSETSDGWYMCTPCSVGNSSLFFMAYADRYYLPQTLTVQVDVSEGHEAYTVNNTYTIQSADSSGTILQELMLNRIPNQNSAFYLAWTTTDGGTLVYRKSGGASTEGTFTRVDDKAYSFVTDDWTLDVALTATGSRTYTFEQDLTEELQQLHPDCGVEKVLISSEFSSICYWYTD